MFVVPFVKQWPYQPYFTLDVITRIVSDSSIWQVYEHSIGVALVSAAVGTIFVTPPLWLRLDLNCLRGVKPQWIPLP